MHSKTWVLAAALALASTVVADEGLPRIYFPRHVKRQFVNSTTTRTGTFPTVETPDPTSDTTVEDSIAGSTENVEDVLDVSTTASSFSVPRDESSDILTLSIPTTVLVSLTGTASSTELPDIIVQPTPSKSVTEEEEEEEEKEEPASSAEVELSTTESAEPSTSEIILAPTGIVIPIPIPIEEDETTTASPVEEQEPTATPTSPSKAPEVEEPKETEEEKPPVVTPQNPSPSDVVDPIETILDPIETAISSIIDVIPVPGPTGTSLTDVIIPIPGPTGAVTTDPVVIPPVSETTTILNPGPTSIPVISDTEGPVIPSPTELPGGTGVSPGGPSGTGVTPSATITDDPVEPVVTPPPANNSTVIEDPTDNASPLPPVKDTATFTSVPAVSTVIGKEAWLGTKLIADDASSTVNPNLPAPTNGESLPEGMPATIDASDDDIPQPDGTTLIRIVFDRHLHYEFVADNYTASQQIFTFLPQILSYAEGIEAKDVKMMSLVPIETKQKKGWITTAAMGYVPTSIIESLQIDIHLTNSALYHHPHPIAYQLGAAIDPSFGIFPGSEGDAAQGGAFSGPGGAPFGDTKEKPEEQTPQQKGATAGIAFGAVSVAVAYGAAMFLVARRYKRKKQAHRRTSSVSGDSNGSSDMRFSETGSPATAMMGGALLSRDFSSYGGASHGSPSHGSPSHGAGSYGPAGGRESHGSGRSGAGNSGRTAYISAPVAAENSLGWN